MDPGGRGLRRFRGAAGERGAAGRGGLGDEGAAGSPEPPTARPTQPALPLRCRAPVTSLRGAEGPAPRWPQQRCLRGNGGNSSRTPPLSAPRRRVETLDASAGHRCALSSLSLRCAARLGAGTTSGSPALAEGAGGGRPPPQGRVGAAVTWLPWQRGSAAAAPPRPGLCEAEAAAGPLLAMAGAPLALLALLWGSQVGGGRGVPVFRGLREGGKEGGAEVRALCASPPVTASPRRRRAGTGAGAPPGGARSVAAGTGPWCGRSARPSPVCGGTGRGVGVRSGSRGPFRCGAFRASPGLGRSRRGLDPTALQPF